MDPSEYQALSEYIPEEEFHWQSLIAMQDFDPDDADERDRLESSPMELYDIEEAEKLNRRALQIHGDTIPGETVSRCQKPR